MHVIKCDKCGVHEDDIFDVFYTLDVWNKEKTMNEYEINLCMKCYDEFIGSLEALIEKEQREKFMLENSF